MTSVGWGDREKTEGRWGVLTSTEQPWCGTGCAGPLGFLCLPILTRTLRDGNSQLRFSDGEAEA